ncbi:crotonase/enoyl-CoA hydratase family protein [Streptomyces sp. NPDC048277]|uniref:crotonase/enoyl-CoA hydratase family protein n=1 Tax=Streptomyces sp. NPDC048277 TaxID=3155027 RepID=UPI0033DEBBAC
MTRTVTTAPTATATEPVVLSEIRDRVGILTLNRPRVRNALDLQLREEMQRVLKEFDADPAVRAVVLMGAGGSFCSGQDLKAAAAGEPMYRDRAAQQSAFNRTSVRKPVIAAVQGHCLAGGFELALSCDLIVADRDASFGLPEVRRNLVAVGGGLIRLPLRIPYHRAMELALTGEPVGAEKMAEWGVVSRVVDPGTAPGAAVDLGRLIGRNGPTAVRATKEIVRRAHAWGSEADAFDAQLAAAEPAFSSPDRKEGVAAFLEKRDPVWTCD